MVPGSNPGFPNNDLILETGLRKSPSDFRSEISLRLIRREVLGFLCVRCGSVRYAVSVAVSLLGLEMVFCFVDSAAAEYA